MTDEERVFHEDSRDKKRTAYSANKKPIRNSRRCHFPSDYKTKKEIEKMSGEMITYDLSKPMKWGAFSDMPEDLQKKYLTSLQLKYKASAHKLADMFGVSPNAVSVRMRTLGVAPLPKGCRVYPEWESFLKYGTPTREANVDNYKAEPVPCEPAPVTNVLDRRMLLDIAYSAGALYAFASVCNESNVEMLLDAVEKLWNIATTVSIGEGKE